MNNTLAIFVLNELEEPKDVDTRRPKPGTYELSLVVGGAGHAINRIKANDVHEAASKFAEALGAAIDNEL